MAWLNPVWVSALFTRAILWGDLVLKFGWLIVLLFGLLALRWVAEHSIDTSGGMALAVFVGGAMVIVAAWRLVRLLRPY